MKQLIIFGLTLLIMSSDYETQKYEVVLKDNNFEIRRANKLGDITASEHFLGKTIAEITILFPALVIFDYLTIALTNHPIQSTIIEYIPSLRKSPGISN